MNFDFTKIITKRHLIILAFFACFFISPVVKLQANNITGTVERIVAAAAESGIKVYDIKPLEIDSALRNLYTEKYQLFVEQPIDHKNPALGTFKQKVVLFHTGYDRPMLFVTEGYSSRGAMPRYNNELSTLFNTNMIEVEHRYFSQSVPFKQQDSTLTDETLDWSYMTALNEAADLHRVNTLFKTIYPGKWMATGISKGGQTTMFYTAYYPNDVDVSVPYVGPLCKGVEDGRHEPFLKKNVGTAKDREIIHHFQIEFLKRRSTIEPMLKDWITENKYTFRIPVSAVYDYTVLEFPFAFWQWGYKTDIIPDIQKAEDKEMFDFIVKINDPSYFAEGGDTAPFFVQAAKELGYYGYDTKPYKNLLSIRSAKDYLHKIFLPQNREFTFDKYLYKDVKRFLDTTRSKMMFIYGEYDPWSAVMPVAPVKNEKLKSKGKGRQNIYLFIDPQGSHRSRINTLPTEMQQEAISVLNKWLNE